MTDFTGHSIRQLEADLARLRGVLTLLDIVLPSIKKAAELADTTDGEAVLSALETDLVDQQRPALLDCIDQIQDELNERDARAEREHERIELMGVRR